MSELLRTILIMSISGSIVALLLFALKPLIRNRLPKSVQYYLWLVVIAALLVPVSKIIVLANNGPSQISVVPNISETVARYAITQEEEMDRLQNIPLPIDKDNPEYMHERRTAQSPFSMATTYFIMAYPIGAVIVLLYTIVTFAVFTRRLKRRNQPAEVSCDISVYRNPLAATPMLIGLFRPIIILPDREYTDRQLRAVLLHELTHLRRKDVLIKWLSVLVTALHWFNPIVWLVRREIDRACELSCDETVIRNLDTDGKQNYGETLIYVAADSKTPHAVLSTTMCEEKKALKERLGAIMKSKRHTRLAIIISAVLLVAVGGMAIALGVGRADVLALPDADMVLSISMNQYNDYTPIGEVVITDKNEIAKILNDLSGASKLWGMAGTSVNDYPVDDNFLVVEVTTQNGSRRLSLYTDDRDYIEEPYIGTYRAKQRFDNMYSLYSRYSDIVEPDAASVGILPENLNAPDAVLNSVIDWVKGDFEGHQDVGLAVLKEAGAEFDNWRIDFIEHVYRYDDRNIDVYRFQWRIHTTTPDVVRNALAGGMDLDDEGWLLDTYPNSWYLIVIDDEAQFAMMANDCSPGDELFTEDMRKRFNSENTLPLAVDEAINAAIIAKNRGSYGGGGDFSAASAVTLKTVEHDEYITAYIMAYYTEYSNLGWLHQTAGSHIPVAITFDKTTFEVTEYWEAEDGSRYWPSIRGKFPKDTWDKIDTQLYVKEQEENCLRQAQLYYNGALTHAITQDGSRLRISGYGDAYLSYDPSAGDMYIAESLPIPQFEDERVEGSASFDLENMDIINIRLTVSRPDPGSGTVEGPHVVIAYSLKYDRVDELICEPFVNSTGEQFIFELSKENALAVSRLLSEAIQLCNAYGMYNR